MLKAILKLFGSQNERTLKRIDPLMAAVNGWAPKMESLSDEALKAKTAEFRDRLSQGQSPDDLLPEAFAVVREAAKRAIGLRPYDVQVVGGVVLHQGKIAEMKTGEGKTLVAT